MTAIKFNKFNVQNIENGAKARVYYSPSTNYGKDARTVVVLYSKDYGHDLAKVFEGQVGTYRNDTDIMTDYFDKGRIVIEQNSDLYPAALAMAQRIAADNAAKWEKKHGRPTDGR